MIHKHTNAVPVGDGVLIINDKKIKVKSAQIYLFPTDNGDEQRICMTINNNFDIPKNQPFVDIILDKPYLAGFMKIKRIKIFLLSATYNNGKIDALISPRNKFIDEELKKMW